MNSVPFDDSCITTVQSNLPLVQKDRISHLDLPDNIENSIINNKRLVIHTAHSDHETKRLKTELDNTIHHLFDSDSELTPLEHSPFMSSTAPSPRDFSDTDSRKRAKFPKPIPAMLLANPFQPKKPGMFTEIEVELKSDLETIREASGSAETDERSKEVFDDLQSQGRTRGSAALPTGTKFRRSPQKNRNFENNDNCSACLGIGELLCCDTCPNVFHFECVAEGFDHFENEPDESWRCNSCRSRKKKSPSTNGLFGPLLDSIEGLNPRAFQLPTSLRDQYEHVVTHPITGAYIDTRKVEISKAFQQILRSSKIKPLSAKDKNNQKLESFPKCFHCSRTDSIFNPLFNSHTMPPPTPIPQSQRSELIKCDYCDMYWHLDCLDPPLSCLPPELRMDEYPTLDLYAHALLKEKIWNGPLDQPLYTIPNILGNRKIYGTRDIHMLSQASPHSGIFDHDRFVKIRSRWMCPLHADWETPSYPRVKWTDDKSEKKKGMFRLVYRDAGSASSSRSQSPTPLDSERLKKNGWISIDNEPSTLEIFQPPTTRLGERKIYFDFIQKVEDFCQDLPIEPKIRLREDIYEKFKEFGQVYTSRLDLLYQQQSRIKEFIPVVDEIVKDDVQVPKNLKDAAAAMLLFQLDLQNRFIDRHLKDDQ